MRRPVRSLLVIFLLIGLVTACGGQPTPDIIRLPTPPTSTSAPTAAVQATAAVQPTAAAKATAPQTTIPGPAVTAGPAGTAVKGALTCPSAAPLPANAQLAARVNGQGISLDLFNRQVAQAEAAFLQQGIDPKSPGGQEALKSLRQQVLDQMINDLVISQQAEKEGIRVTDNDLNARLAEMIQDAGSVDKLNEYLAKNQLTLTDFCSQIRSNILGEAMMNRITSAFPTNAEQVHVRQILVASPQIADQVLKQARAGQDFAALAKQYSMDESTKVNGGDLGWVPKGVLAPELDAVMFQAPVGSIPEVVTTQFGYHVIKIEGREKSRPLPAEMLQNARQQAFLTWIQAVRESMKIERLVQF